MQMLCDRSIHNPLTVSNSGQSVLVPELELKCTNALSGEYAAAVADGTTTPLVGYIVLLKMCYLSIATAAGPHCEASDATTGQPHCSHKGKSKG